VYTDQRPYRAIPVDKTILKEGEQFIYGWYFKAICPAGKVDTVKHFIIKKEWSVLYVDSKKAISLYVDCFVEVIPETVSQQVGLKHEKRDIYGGDMFQGKKSGIKLLVEYVEGEYRLTKKVEYAHYRVKHCDLHYGLVNLSLEYIGNIHTEVAK
jgi:hypothetical protein